MCSGCPSVRTSVSPLSVNTYFTRRDISVFSVCMYVWRSDFNETWHKNSSYERALLKSFQDQRSKVKIVRRPNALLWRKHAFQRSGVEAYLFGKQSPIVTAYIGGLRVTPKS